MTTARTLSATHHASETDARRAPGSPAARILVTVAAVTTMLGAYVADFNATHIYNPTWPPHAKFHNAQTMLLATALGACALVYAWRRAATTTHVRTAILFASLYWFTSAGSIAFPGTAWTDPDRAGQGLVLGVPVAAAIGFVELALLGAALVLSRAQRAAD